MISPPWHFRLTGGFCLPDDIAVERRKCFLPKKWEFSRKDFVRQKQKADAGGTGTGLDFLDGHRRSQLYRGAILPLPNSFANFLV